MICNDLFFIVTGLNLWLAVALITGVALLYTVMVGQIIHPGVKSKVVESQYFTLLNTYWNCRGSKYATLQEKIGQVVDFGTGEVDRAHGRGRPL